jgi:hypothetical protein
MSDWRTKARERVKEKKSGTTFKLVEGTNGFRILPNKLDLQPDGRPKKEGIQNPPFLELRVHRDVGPDKSFCTCGLDIEGNGKCWLCQVKIPELEASKAPAKKEQAFAIGARETFLIQVSRIDTETGKFSMPKPFWPSNGKGIPGRPAKRPTLATQIQSAILNSRKDFIDPAKGYNMYINRTGMGPRDTTYDPPEADENPSKVPLAILAQVKPFEELFRPYDEEDQKAAYFGRPRREERAAEDEGEEGEAEEGAEGEGYEEGAEGEGEPEYEEGAEGEAEPEYEEGAEGEAEPEYEEGAEGEAEEYPEGEEPPEPEYEEGTEGEAEPEYEEEPEPEPEPAPRRATRPAAKQAPRPATKQAPRPAAKQAPKPAGKQAPKPATKTAPKGRR